MFVRLAQQLQSRANARNTVDPSLFADPIAMRTEWTPVQGGGVIGDKMVRVSSERIEFRASLGATLACLVFLLAGLGVLIGFPVHQYSSGRLSADKDTIMPMVIGLIFTLAGCFLLYVGTVPVVFDKRKGFFWKGRQSPGSDPGGPAPAVCAKLESIHALQLLRELCTGSKSGSYYRYELNLVMEDARRIAAISHGKKTVLRARAKALSEFLGKPVWDAIDLM